MFSIGKAPIQNKYRSKKKVYHSINSKKIFSDPNIRFTQYTGYRWHIPSGINVSDSIRMKFMTFETKSIKTLFRDINFKINSKLSISSQFYNTRSWKPPQQVISAIQSFKDKQINEFKKVKVLYKMIFRIMYYLKKLIYIRRINKSLRNLKNTVDIVTLDVALKPVYVIDIKRQISYVYEASTIRRAIESKLTYSDSMFPEVKEPINMFTNQPFTYTQLISITNQCIKHGEFSWIIDRLKRCNYSVCVFEKVFKQQLKLEAINSYFKNMMEDVKETVTDYFESIAYMNLISGNKIILFRELINECPNHPNVKKWVNLTRRYYTAVELRDTKDIYNIDIEASMLVIK